MKLSSQWIFAVLISIPISSQAIAKPPTLQSDSEIATAGYYRLSWEGIATSDYLLQEASDPDFTNVKTLYEGPDTASLISGRSNGVYYYRVRTIDQAEDPDAWSNVAKVEVTHHPLSRAFMFFALGAIVFFATLIVVVVGNKTHRH